MPRKREPTVRPFRHPRSSGSTLRRRWTFTARPKLWGLYRALSSERAEPRLGRQFRGAADRRYPIARPPCAWSRSLGHMPVIEESTIDLPERAIREREATSKPRRLSASPAAPSVGTTASRLPLLNCDDVRNELPI